MGLVWRETGAVRNAPSEQRLSGVYLEEDAVDKTLRSFPRHGLGFFGRLLTLLANELWTVYPRNGIL